VRARALSALLALLSDTTAAAAEGAEPIVQPWVDKFIQSVLTDRSGMRPRWLHRWQRRGADGCVASA